MHALQQHVKMAALAPPRTAIRILVLVKRVIRELTDKHVTSFISSFFVF